MMEYKQTKNAKTFAAGHPDIAKWSLGSFLIHLLSWSSILHFRGLNIFLHNRWNINNWGNKQMLSREQRGKYRFNQVVTVIMRMRDEAGRPESFYRERTLGQLIDETLQAHPELRNPDNEKNMSGILTRQAANPGPQAMLEVISNGQDASVRRIKVNSQTSEIGRFGVGGKQILGEIQNPGESGIFETSADGREGFRFVFVPGEEGLFLEEPEIISGGNATQGTKIVLNKELTTEAMHERADFLSWTERVNARGPIYVIVDESENPGENWSSFNPSDWNESSRINHPEDYRYMNEPGRRIKVDEAVPPVYVKITRRGYMIIDSGTGMGLKDFYERYLIPKHSDKSFNGTVEEAKVLYKPSSAETTGVSLMTTLGLSGDGLPTAGTEDVTEEGRLNLVDDLFLVLPHDTRISEERSTIHLNGENPISIAGLKLMIDRLTNSALALSDEDRFALINTIAAKLRAKQAKERVTPEDDLLTYLGEKLYENGGIIEKQAGNALFFPNKRQWQPLTNAQTPEGKRIVFVDEGVVGLSVADLLMSKDILTDVTKDPLFAQLKKGRASLYLFTADLGSDDVVIHDHLRNDEVLIINRRFFDQAKSGDTEILLNRIAQTIETPVQNGVKRTRKPFRFKKLGAVVAIVAALFGSAAAAGPTLMHMLANNPAGIHFTDTSIDPTKAYIQAGSAGAFDSQGHFTPGWNNPSGSKGAYLQYGTATLPYINPSETKDISPNLIEGIYPQLQRNGSFTGQDQVTIEHMNPTMTYVGFGNLSNKTIKFADADSVIIGVFDDFGHSVPFKQTDGTHIKVSSYKQPPYIHESSLQVVYEFRDIRTYYFLTGKINKQYRVTNRTIIELDNVSNGIIADVRVTNDKGNPVPFLLLPNDANLPNYRIQVLASGKISVSYKLYESTMNNAYVFPNEPLPPDEIRDIPSQWRQELDKAKKADDDQTKLNAIQDIIHRYAVYDSRGNFTFDGRSWMHSAATVINSGKKLHLVCNTVSALAFVMAKYVGLDPSYVTEEVPGAHGKLLINSPGHVQLAITMDGYNTDHETWVIDPTSWLPVLNGNLPNFGGSIWAFPAMGYHALYAALGNLYDLYEAFGFGIVVLAPLMIFRAYRALRILLKGRMQRGKFDKYAARFGEMVSPLFVNKDYKRTHGIGFIGKMRPIPFLAAIAASFVFGGFIPGALVFLITTFTVFRNRKPFTYRFTWGLVSRKPSNRSFWGGIKGDSLYIEKNDGTASLESLTHDGQQLFIGNHLSAGDSLYILASAPGPQANMLFVMTSDGVDEIPLPRELNTARSKLYLSPESGELYIYSPVWRRSGRMLYTVTFDETGYRISKQKGPGILHNESGEEGLSIQDVKARDEAAATVMLDGNKRISIKDKRTGAVTETLKPEEGSAIVDGDIFQRPVSRNGIQYLLSSSSNKDKITLITASKGTYRASPINRSELFDVETDRPLAISEYMARKTGLERKAFRSWDSFDIMPDRITPEVTGETRKGKLYVNDNLFPLFTFLKWKRKQKTRNEKKIDEDRPYLEKIDARARQALEARAGRIQNWSLAFLYMNQWIDYFANDISPEVLTRMEGIAKKELESGKPERQDWLREVFGFISKIYIAKTPDANTVAGRYLDIAENEQFSAFEKTMRGELLKVRDGIRGLDALKLDKKTWKHLPALVQFFLSYLTEGAQQLLQEDETVDIPWKPVRELNFPEHESLARIVSLAQQTDNRDLSDLIAKYGDETVMKALSVDQGDLLGAVNGQDVLLDGQDVKELVQNARDAQNEEPHSNRTIAIRSYIDNGHWVVSVQDDAGATLKILLNNVFGADASTKDMESDIRRVLNMDITVQEKIEKLAKPQFLEQIQDPLRALLESGEDPQVLAHEIAKKFSGKLKKLSAGFAGQGFKTSYWKWDEVFERFGKNRKVFESQQRSTKERTDGKITKVTDIDIDYLREYDDPGSKFKGGEIRLSRLYPEQPEARTAIELENAYLRFQIVRLVGAISNRDITWNGEVVNDEMTELATEDGMRARLSDMGIERLTVSEIYIQDIASELTQLIPADITRTLHDKGLNIDYETAREVVRTRTSIQEPGREREKAVVSYL
ncbi:MAG: hypothetical protein ABSH12_06475, partial [Endomicrobiales bacterium]